MKVPLVLWNLKFSGALSCFISSFHSHNDSILLLYLVRGSWPAILGVDPKPELVHLCQSLNLYLADSSLASFCCEHKWLNLEFLQNFVKIEHFSIFSFSSVVLQIFRQFDFCITKSHFLYIMQKFPSVFGLLRGYSLCSSTIIFFGIYTLWNFYGILTRWTSMCSLPFWPGNPK